MKELPVIGLARVARPSPQDPAIWFGSLTPQEAIYALRRSAERGSRVKALKLQLEERRDRGDERRQDIVFTPNQTLLEELQLVQAQQ